MSLGFRILPAAPRPSKTLVDGLGQQVTPHLSDSMNRIQGASSAIRPMHKINTAQGIGKLVGVALTVRVSAGDNLMVHKAIDIAQPGDVIVVDAGSFVEQAIIGDIMSTHAKSRGVAGFIIDGAIRDAGEVASRDYPIYARAATHRGPYKNGPGEINVPVSIGGMVVNPGDIIVGDEDGVVSVPVAVAEEILASARSIKQKEEKALQAIAAGNPDRRWVDEALKAKGCKFG
jgi:RraA family protein